MTLRKVLIELVVLSMLFSALVAGPLHSALHLHHSEPLTAHALEHAADTETTEQEAAVDTLCAWCLVPAFNQFGWLAVPLASDLAGPIRQLHVLPATSVFGASQNSWSFSSRDPPCA